MTTEHSVPAPSRAPGQAPGDGEWIPAGVLAEMLGIARQNVHKACMRGRFTWRQVKGDTGGRRLEVALASLPENLRIRYLQRAAGSPADAGMPSHGQRAENKEPEPAGTAYEKAPAADRAEADRRLAILTAWREHVAPGEDRKTRTRLTLELIRTQRDAGAKLSKTALYEWDGRHMARGLDGLLPQRGGGRRSTVGEEDKALFLSLWGEEARPKIASLYHGYLLIRKREAVPGPTPSLGAIRYMIDQLSEEEQAALRRGDKAYRQMVMPYIERDYESLLPNDWWCMDHHQIDVIALDRRGRRCRPWVTAVMDLRTRRVIVVISAQPTQDVVLYCLRTAILAWGLPRNIYLDNGKEFIAKSVSGGRKRFRLALKEGRVRSLCHQLGIDVHFAIKFNAQAKPVERWFGSMAEGVSKLFWSYCGRSPAERPEELKDRLSSRQLPTGDEIADALQAWIDTEYHQRPHHGDGMNGNSPNDVAAQLADQVIKRVATPEQLQYFLLRSVEAEIKRSEVAIFGVRYWPAAENPDCLYGWQGKKAVGHFDPADMTRIFLTDPEDNAIGWLVDKKRIGWGAVATDDIRAAKRLQARSRALQRQARADLAAHRLEPDALARVLRERTAEPDPPCGPGPKSGPQGPGSRRRRPGGHPVGVRPISHGAGVVEMVPATPAQRASARAAAKRPTLDEERAKPPLPYREMVQLAIGGGERQAPSAKRMASDRGKSAYDEALALILQGDDDEDGNGHQG